MILTDLLFALFFAVLLSAVFYGLFRTKGPWSSLVLFFIVIFLAAWAGGVWLTPFGPFLWGVSWLPFLFAGLLIALILAAAAPRDREESTVELVDTRERTKERKTAVTVLSVFFWILIGVLIAAIAGHYVSRPV